MVVQVLQVAPRLPRAQLKLVLAQRRRELRRGPRPVLGQQRGQRRVDLVAPGRVPFGARALLPHGGEALGRVGVEHGMHRLDRAAEVRGAAGRRPAGGRQQQHLYPVALAGPEGGVVAGLL
jgi:hypothetical protein